MRLGVLAAAVLGAGAAWDLFVAQGSVLLLLKGAYAFTFLGLVLAVGLFGTFVFALANAWMQLHWLVLLVAACELAGDYALLMVLLKSGLLAAHSAPHFEQAPPAVQLNATL